jgi:hypothetical protein
LFINVPFFNADSTVLLATQQSTLDFDSRKVPEATARQIAETDPALAGREPSRHTRYGRIPQMCNERRFW